MKIVVFHVTNVENAVSATDHFQVGCIFKSFHWECLSSSMLTLYWSNWFPHQFSSPQNDSSTTDIFLMPSERTAKNNKAIWKKLPSRKRLIHARVSILSEEKVAILSSFHSRTSYKNRFSFCSTSSYLRLIPVFLKIII